MLSFRRHGLSLYELQQKALADFNGDGDVDISDATDIQIAISR